MVMNIRDILLDGERVTLECKKATKGGFTCKSM